MQAGHRSTPIPGQPSEPIHTVFPIPSLLVCAEECNSDNLKRFGISTAISFANKVRKITMLRKKEHAFSFAFRMRRMGMTGGRSDLLIARMKEPGDLGSFSCLCRGYSNQMNKNISRNDGSYSFSNSAS